MIVPISEAYDPDDVWDAVRNISSWRLRLACHESVNRACAEIQHHTVGI